MSSDDWLADAANEAEDALDELAAGDEVEDVEEVLRHMSGQLEALGGGEAARPLAHAVVPNEGAGLALPSGKATINFRDGRVEHEDLSGIVEEFPSLDELSAALGQDDLALQNLIFHADSVASAKPSVGPDQKVFFQNIPLPFEGYEAIEVELNHPAEISVLASTKELPIGLGAITVVAHRHGEQSGTLDSLTTVPVAPFALWDDHGGSTHAEAAVYAAQFDTATITAENTSGNGNDVEVHVEARESYSSTASWREIASDTVPDGDHSVFNVTERHKLLRTRIKNTTAGNTVSATTDWTLANP